METKKKHPIGVCMENLFNWWRQDFWTINSMCARLRMGVFHYLGVLWSMTRGDFNFAIFDQILLDGSKI